MSIGPGFGSLSSGAKPMRLAVLADVHGNLPALEAVLADALEASALRTIVAGDFTCGSQSQEVIDRLRGLDGWLTRGNSEGYVLALDRREVPQGWWEGEHWAFTRWSYQHLDRDALRFIDRGCGAIGWALESDFGQ